MTRLPPLADLAALTDPDPERLHSAARMLESEGWRVWRPHARWVAAERPLPGRDAGDAGREHGLAFAQGAERVPSPPHLQQLAERATGAPETLAAQPGDLTFLAFDEAGGVTAVRSCGGLVPVWTWQEGERAAVATTLGALLDLLPVVPALDRLTCAMWASMQMSFPDGRGFHERVRLVPLGHAAALRPRRGWTTQRYWDLRPADPADVRHAPEEHAGELRSLLVGSLERDLDDGGPNLLSLSGGVDSTSLLALAAGTLGRDVVTFTVVPDDEPSRERELGYIEQVMRRVPVRRRFDYVWYPETWRPLYSRRWEIPFPVTYPALLALPEILEQQPVRVLFGGDFADDVCGHWWRIHDWIDATSPGALVAGLRRLPFGRSDTGRWVKWRLRAAAGRPRLPLREGLAEYIRPEIQEEYAQWYAERLRAHRSDKRPNRHLAVQIELNSDAMLCMHWEASSSLRVRRSFPFHEREMLELAGRSDVREQLGPGFKRVLRRALQNDVPAANLDRPDKGRWGGGSSALVEPWTPWRPGLLDSILVPEWHDGPPRATRAHEVIGLESVKHVSGARVRSA